ncbi:MAG TPA: hypothetical protein VF874_18275 [Mycobacterium sp.]
MATRGFVVNAGTPVALAKWTRRWASRRFAIKGANGLGRGIAQVLVTADKDVVDVPSTLAMKVRVLSTGGGRKTDPDDAYAVALCALHHKGLHAVHRKDQTTILRLLSERRPPVEPRSDCPPTQRLFVIQSALAALWSAPLWSSQRSR